MAASGSESNGQALLPPWRCELETMDVMDSDEERAYINKLRIDNSEKKRNSGIPKLTIRKPDRSAGRISLCPKPKTHTAAPKKAIPQEKPQEKARPHEKLLLCRTRPPMTVWQIEQKKLQKKKAGEPTTEEEEEEESDDLGEQWPGSPAGQAPPDDSQLQ